MSPAARRASLVTGGLLLLSFLHPLGLRINWHSDSQPRGLYWRTPWEEGKDPLRRGDLVLVELPEEIARLGQERGYLHFPTMAKCVAALPGDAVEVTEEGMWIHGRRLEGTAPLLRDSQGRKVERYRAGLHDTLPGTVWLYSNHIPHSWDSRYFGPVPTASIRGRLKPLLTFPPFPRNGAGEPWCPWTLTAP